MTNEAAGFDSARKNVLICDTQPVAVEGMKWLIESSGDLHFIGSVPTLDAVYMLLNPEAARMAAEAAAAQAALELAQAASEMEVSQVKAVVAEAPESEALEIGTVGEIGTVASEVIQPEVAAMAASATGCEDVAGYGAPCPVDATSVEAPAVEALAVDERELVENPEPVLETASEPEALPPAIPIDAVVIDKGLGFAGVMELLHKLAATSHPTPAIVWGSAISESEALRLLQAGARGIVRRTSDSDTLLTCLRAVTGGGTWMEDGIFGSTEKLFNPRRSQLTQRESEVVVLVEKGLRNRDIARLLGIQTGTVKIHLKHIFEKTGVRGRYGLAFTGLQNKGTIALTAPPQFTA